MMKTALGMIIVSIITLLVAGVAVAAVWHLAPEGDDQGGTGGPESPFAGIGRSVEAAADGDTILFWPGTFVGAGQRGVQVDGLALNLISRDGPGTVTIDLELQGDCLNFSGSVTDTSLIAGLDFSNGAGSNGGTISLCGITLRMTGCRLDQSEALLSGGAIHVGRGATLLCDGCIFSGNHSDDEGGALFFAPESAGMITDCLLVGNGAEVVLESEMAPGQSGNIDGLAWVDFPIPTIPWSSLAGVRVHLREIWVERAALSGTELQLWLERFGCMELTEQIEHPDCDERYSDEGCLNLTGYWSGDSLATIPEPWTFPSDSMISMQGNIYDCGTGEWCQCWVSGKGCQRGWALPLGSFEADLEMIRHQSGRQYPGGGAIALADSVVLTVTHCTIVGNQSGFGGGGLSAGDDCSFLVANSIIHGNSAPEGAGIASAHLAGIEVYSCNIQGSDWWGGNIDLDPFFVAPGSVPEGYALSDSSPCLGLGDLTWTDPLDLLGVARPAPTYTQPDLGCLESVRGWPVGVIQEIPPGPAVTTISVFPNPFNPRVTISLGISRADNFGLSIHDVAGRRLDVIHRGVLTAGRHDFSWDGTDATGDNVSSGVYFARLVSRDQVITEKLVLMR